VPRGAADTRYVKSGRKDVTIYAPPAVGHLGSLRPGAPPEPPSPHEIIQAQAAQIRELYDEIEKYKVASGTLGGTATQLVRLLNEERGVPLDTPVRIPRYWIDKLDGSVSMAETDDRDLIVRFRERIHNPGWEGA
jgi:hypothetical protein